MAHHHFRRCCGTAILLGLACAIASAQSSSDLPKLLQQLQSTDMLTRETAFAHITAIPHADTRPEVQKAFVLLLQVEDNLINATNLANHNGGVDSSYGEGYAEYTAAVLDEVFKYAQLADSDDHATILAILHAPANPETEVSKWLATRIGLSTADVLAMSRNAVVFDRAYARSELADMLVAARKGKRQMSEGDKQAAKQGIVAGLSDADPPTRDAAIESLVHLGDPSDAAIVQKMAENDPEPTVRAYARNAAKYLEKQPPVAHP